MPILSNQKHERFAQEVAKGTSASAAYVAAGYTKNDGNASRLNSVEKVRARVEELQQKAAEATGVTIQGIVEALADIAFVERKGTQEKTVDRLAALEKLGKHLGMFKDKVEHSGQVSSFSFKLDKANEND